MQPIIENLICMGDDRVAFIFASLLNTITWATNEDTLRRGIQRFAEEEPLFTTYFAYGFEKHHYWLHQRKFSDPQKLFDYLLL